MENTDDLKTPEQLVAHVELLLNQRDFDAAQEAFAAIDERFPDSALAQHLAGLVFERSYAEQNAEGLAPGLSLYEKAERHYRRALELDPAQVTFHGPRLYACLFVLGTQRQDVGRLNEALQLAAQLADESDPEYRAHYAREQAIVSGAIAQITDDEKDFVRAEDLFARAPEPQEDRESFFFHYYRGMLKRRLGQRDDEPRLLRQAIDSFRKAAALNPRRAIEYLLADCLVQLHDPSAEELDAMERLIPRLLAEAPEDKLVKLLHQRWIVRRKLIDKDQGDNARS